MLDTMKTTIDKAGRLVIPRPMRDRLGLTGGAAVEIEIDGADLRIRPLTGDRVREEGDLLIIPRTGAPIDDALVRELIDADRYGR